MPGTSELLLLAIAVAALFLIPRFQRRLEEQVDEEALGRRAFEAIAQRHSVRRLKSGEVPATLARFAKVRRLRVNHYTAHATDEPGVNALALPGGWVVLTDGLLALRAAGTMSEDELAAVVAHEMGHIELGHSRRGHVRDQLGGWATSMGPTPGGPVGRFVMGLGLKALRRRASRDAETEADAWACGLRNDAGYDVTALETFLARTEVWGASGGLWSTHPSPRTRIAALRAARAG